MTFTQNIAFSRIQRRIIEAEERTDQALLSKVELMKELVAARLEFELDSNAVGQDAIVRLGKSISTEITAMNELLRTHSALTDTAKVVSGVDHDDKPVWPSLATESEAA